MTGASLVNISIMDPRYHASGLPTNFNEPTSSSSRKPLRAKEASGDDKKESLYEQLLRFHQEEEEQRKPEASLSVRVPISRPYSMSPTMTRANSSSTGEPTYSDRRASQLSSTAESANQRQPVVRQSSFYRAAIEAMGEHAELPKPNVSLDEQFAKELSRQVEEEERAERLRDEALARELAETLRIEAEATKRDERLAREYTKNRNHGVEADEALALELTRKQQLTSRQPSQTETLKDEAIALELMRAESNTTSRRPSQQEMDEDTALALALAQEENPPPPAPPTSMALPEQLKILEQIKKQREQPMSMGMLESSDDFVISQRLAMQEWVEYQERQQLAPSLREASSWSGSSNQSQQRWNGQHPQARTRPNWGEDRRIYSQSDYHFPQSDLSQQSSAMIPPRYSRPTQAPQRGLSDVGPLRGGYAQNDQHSRSPRRQQRHVHFDDQSVQSAPVLRGSTDFPDRSQPTPDLLQRGHMETRVAIDEGRSHVVLCQGCNSRLHAPMSYALVFCPSCHTVSPGQTAVRREHLQN